MSLPTLAIVGRPNVGKSTLFNRLTGGRRAIVHDTPGVTRDRLYGRTDWDGVTFRVIDTGGFDPQASGELWSEMRRQVRIALDEADAVILVMDGREGLTPADEEVAALLREEARVPVYLAVNKIDSTAREGETADFYRTGWDTVLPISAEHGRGVDELLDAAVRDIGAKYPPETSREDRGGDEPIRVAVVGRPNAGKSTFINHVLGVERLLTSATPGTTRDAVDVEVQRDGRRIIFIDTAGIRRRGKTEGRIEKVSVVKALDSLDRADVALLFIDATERVTEQDAKISGLITRAGAAVVIVVNKWDAVEKDTYTIHDFEDRVREKMKHLSFAPIVTASALTGQRLDKIFDAIVRVAEQHKRRVPTHELNQVLEDAIAAHPPPIVRNRQTKMYYATQPTVRPPTFIIFTNFPSKIHFSYERYLENRFREAFGFEGSPIRISFRSRHKH